MYDAEEIFFLTAAEYAILLAGKGVKRHYTLQADTEELGEKEICLAMGHLYQTGLIDSDSEQFFIQEHLEKLLTTIGEAERLLLVRFGRAENRDFCCFLKGEEVTFLRLSERDRNSYELFKGSKGMLAAQLGKCLETDEKHEPVLEEEEYYRNLKGSRESVTREMIRRFHNLLLSVEEIAPEDGRVNKRLLVCLSEQGVDCDGVGSLEVIQGMLKEIVDKGEN